jgi:hypothetical protein
MKKALFIAIISLLGIAEASAQNQNPQVVYIPQQNFPPVSFNLRPVPTAHPYGKEWDLTTEWDTEWAGVIRTNRYYRTGERYNPGDETLQECILYITENPMRLDASGKNIYSPSNFSSISGYVVLEDGTKFPTSFPILGVIDPKVFTQTQTYPGTNFYVRPVPIRIVRERVYQFDGPPRYSRWFADVSLKII